MLVIKSNFKQVLHDLLDYPALSLDTETHGLRPYHGHRLFSLILATVRESYYFNFMSYPGLDEQYVLGPTHLGVLKARILEDPSRLWFGHNIKFDQHILAQEGIFLQGKLHDTKVGARLLRNDHMTYSLDAVAKRAGWEKSDAVAAYIREHGLWDWVQIPGKKTRDKALYFTKVPFEVIAPYGEQDGRVTYDLAVLQRRELAAKSTDGRPLDKLYEMECELAHVVFEMERRGVLVDLIYCRDSIAHESERLERAEESFLHLTGVPFKDSPKTFAEALPVSPKLSKKTKKPSYDAVALEILSKTSEAAATVLEWRDAKKRLDFYHGFLYHADQSGVMHGNFDSAGTVTGRFSASAPNLQQMSKGEGDEEVPEVRRAIIPRDGFIFVMIDYKTQEMRLMLDYAGMYVADRRLIADVLAGADIHQATADNAGITRQQAKAVNFSIIYGAGLPLLAARLGVPVEEARRIKGSVLDAEPGINIFLRKCMQTAADRGYVADWLGRRWHIDDPKFAYKAPNFICQGGGADVVKMAMVGCHKLLRTYKSAMVLSIHDELVFEIAYDELHLVDELKKIMEGVYPSRFLPLTVDASYSTRSLADKLPWSLPQAEAEIQRRQVQLATGQPRRALPA